MASKEYLSPTNLEWRKQKHPSSTKQINLIKAFLIEARKKQHDVKEIEQEILELKSKLEKMVSDKSIYESRFNEAKNEL